MYVYTCAQTPANVHKHQQTGTNRSQLEREGLPEVPPGRGAACPHRSSLQCHERAAPEKESLMAFLEEKKAFCVYMQLLEWQIHFHSRFLAGPCRAITLPHLLATPFPGQGLVLAAPWCSTVPWGFLVPWKSQSHFLGWCFGVSSPGT